jgi:hypothetical protein
MEFVERVDSKESEHRSRNVVFSFQGAFGPPTVGHYTAMKLFTGDLFVNDALLYLPISIS